MVFHPAEAETPSCCALGFFYDTKEQAIAAVQALQARGVRSLDETFDPRANVAYAARFLNGLFTQLATWPKAAAYHSQAPESAPITNAA